MAASMPLTGDRLPAASTTRSAWTCVAPPMVTPATCGTPAIDSAPVTRPVTATPRQTVRPSVHLAAWATAASSTGRRPVTVSKRSSPSRLPPVISSGRVPSMLVRTPPRASSSAITSGSSRSITARQRGSMKWSWRNWFTPRRSHRCHTSPARPRGPAASRSVTVTWCPSRASSIPAVSPLSPPPITTICAMGRYFVASEDGRCGADGDDVKARIGDRGGSAGPVRLISRSAPDRRAGAAAGGWGGCWTGAAG